MSEEEKPGFLCHFDELEDPRIDRKKLYPLTEILFVVICASICGAQNAVILLFFKTFLCHNHTRLCP